MLSRLTKSGKKSVGVFICFIFFLGGCAQREWRDPLAESDNKKAHQLLEMKIAEQSGCACCLDAEIKVTWQSRMADGALQGYLQLMQPSALKLIAINPLGQPLFIFTTDGRQFQAVNVQDGLYKYGKIATFVRNHSVPENVFHSEYPRWLRGKIISDNQIVDGLFQDTTARGFWVNIKNTKQNRFSGEYLLLDQKNGQLLERVAMDRDGNEAARVIYRSWSSQNGCPQPDSLEIRSPSYGTTIQFEMSDIKTDTSFSQEDFNVKPPRGFLQQFYP